jgi:hypothetical protein
MSLPDFALLGDRIGLHPLDINRDAPEWYAIMQDPAMHGWTGNRVPGSLDEVRDEALATYAQHPGLWVWVVRSVADGGLAGLYWMGIPQRQEPGKILSFDAQRIARRYWRTGVTPEARKLVYHYAFSHLGVDEMHAAAWAGNVNSCRSMEASGFRLLEAQKRWNAKRQESLLEHHYVLLREEGLAAASRRIERCPLGLIDRTPFGGI